MSAQKRSRSDGAPAAWADSVGGWSIDCPDCPLAEPAAGFPAVDGGRGFVSSVVGGGDSRRAQSSMRPPSSNGASTFRRRPKRLVRGWSGRCASTSGDAMVTGWEPLEGTFSLPDPDDEHVVAAAVVGGTGVIVTLNRKDFPRDRVPGHIQVIRCPRQPRRGRWRCSRHGSDTIAGSAPVHLLDVHGSPVGATDIERRDFTFGLRLTVLGAVRSRSVGFRRCRGW